MGKKISADQASNRIVGRDYIFHVKRDHVETFDLGFLPNSNRVDERVLSAFSVKTYADNSCPCSGLKVQFRGERFVDHRDLASCINEERVGPGVVDVGFQNYLVVV